VNNLTNAGSLIENSTNYTALNKIISDTSNLSGIKTELIVILSTDEKRSEYSKKCLSMEQFEKYFDELCEKAPAKLNVLLSDSKIFCELLKRYEVQNVSIDEDKIMLSIYSKCKDQTNVTETHAKVDSLIKQSKELSRYLRKQYFTISNKLTGIRKIPLHGYPKESIVTGSLGAFPEFILPTFPCKKTVEGYCSPCFFSKVAMGDGTTDEIYQSFETQTQFIIDNFDEQILNCQLRKDNETKTLWDVTLCFASNGSIFSNNETTRNSRYNAFKMLYDVFNERNLRSLVYIETCADDYLHLIKSDEFNDLLPFFKRLNVVILCGFESAQAFTRDVLYTKRLTLNEFEDVVCKNKGFGLQSGAFLYSGFYAMTQNEVLLDIAKSLCYLKEYDAIPVIMVPKLHEFTLPDLLYRYRKYNLLDPYSVLRIVKLVTWITKETPTPLRKDRWLMSDLFDDIPPSSTSVFNNVRKFVCNTCASHIISAIQEFRSNLQYFLLNTAEKHVKSCPNNCYNHYLEAMTSEDVEAEQNSLFSRTEALLNFAWKKRRQYVHALLAIQESKKVGKPHISFIRKELLCYGINVDKETLKRLHALNDSFGVAKHVHVAQLKLPDGSYVNAPVLEDYCLLSMYCIREEAGRVYLIRDGIEQFEVTIACIPQWAFKKLSDGTLASTVLSVHGHNTLALVRHNECYYKTNGKGCKYCSSDSYTLDYDTQMVLPKQVAETVKLALAENETYSLALSGGALAAPDRGALYFSKIAKAVLELSPQIGISVEIVPPESNDFIDMLIDAGVKTIIMNLEFYSDEAREKYCPGKFEIDKTRYYASLEYAASKLGFGRVSSVLIAGLESVESTIEGAKKLIDIGVIPTVMPFRPYDNSDMCDEPMSNPDDLVAIENEVNNYINEKKKAFKRPYGCLSCNACIGIDLDLSHNKYEHFPKGADIK